MTRKKRRLMLLCISLLGLGAATALVLTAFEDNLVFFYSPTDIQTKDVPVNRTIRVGGLVEEASIERADGSTAVTFRVTDLSNTLAVSFNGVLPDLFREGQGVVAEGTLGPDGIFRAKDVLAKHDETYMPPEVAAALKKSGQWKPEGSAAQ
ncbi:MAG: cytochrome c maturation protein CcmE [Pseudomonadota bacterium]